MSSGATGRKGLSKLLVGLTVPAFERTIRWADAAAYAAGTFDPNPLYLDDRNKALSIAPPMLAAALTAGGNAEIGARILAESGLAHTDFARQVHYSEIIEFDRPLRPGMTLSIEPAVAAIRPHRRGTELVLRFEAMSDGRPVFREFLGTLVQGLFIPEGEDGGSLPDVPLLRERDSADEDRLASEDFYGVLDAHIYDRCSGISYPVHTSPAEAERAGLGAPLVHGTAVLARALRTLVDEQLDGDPSSIARIAVRFAGMVLPGSTVRIFLTPDHRFRAENANGDAILRHGSVEILG